MDSLVNRKNTVPERQRIYQADPRPVYQRLPRSKLYMGIYMSIFGLGIYGVAGGLWNAAHGKKESKGSS